ncbi:hypothetical protein Hanom_Chr12g01065831 [Helianthus anomalus]
MTVTLLCNKQFFFSNGNCRGQKTHYPTGRDKLLNPAHAQLYTEIPICTQQESNLGPPQRRNLTVKPSLK